MNSTLKRLSVFLTTFLCLTAFSSAAQPGYTPPFFKITYKGNVAYLLGSVHVGKPDFYPLPQLIEKQLNQSDAIVLEAIPSVKDQPLITRYSTQQPRPRRPNHAYEQYCVRQSHFCNASAQLSPWIKATQITMYRLSQHGYQAGFGVESYLTRNKDSKTLMQLESMEFQLKLMSSLDAKGQQTMLTQAITASDARITELFDAWKIGDLKAIELISEQELQQCSDNKFIEKLLWNRNESMAEALISKIKANPDKRLFAAVGAAHLAGDKSINQYLQRSGAKVENCWRTPASCQ